MLFRAGALQARGRAGWVARSSAQVPGPPTPPLQLPLYGLIPWVSGLRALSAGAQSRAGSGAIGVSEPGRVRGHRCVRAGQGPGTSGVSQPGRVRGPGNVLGLVWRHTRCAQLCALLPGGKGSGI